MGYKVNDLVNTGGFPFYLIENLFSKVDVKWGVELGSAGGETARKMATMFEKVWTVELLPDRQIKEPVCENINWIEGHTVDKIPEIINDLCNLREGNDYNYSLWWMDAHYTDEVENTKEHKECYIIEELIAISPIQEEAIIFIDDLRLFCGSVPYPNNPQDWPSLQKIMCVLAEKFPHNYSTITDDYIISIPHRLKSIIDEDWRKMYSIRYPNAETKLKAHVKEVFNALKKYLK